MRRIKIALPEYLKYGGDLAKINTIAAYDTYSSVGGKMKKIKELHFAGKNRSKTSDLYDVIYEDDTKRDSPLGGMWIEVVVDFVLASNFLSNENSV